MAPWRHMLMIVLDPHSKISNKAPDKNPNANAYPKAPPIVHI